MRLHVARRGTSLWDACVTLAQERYAQDYGASITPTPDSFLTLCEDQGGVTVPTACAGLTHGGSRQLLVESYLGRSAPDLLLERTGDALDAHDLVEIGPLASARAAGAGAGLQLIRMVPALCWCNGAQFMFCTITTMLSRTLRKVGIDFVPVAPASESALPADQHGRWGTYYDTAPVAGYIDLRTYAAELVRGPDRAYQLSVAQLAPLPPDLMTEAV